MTVIVFDGRQHVPYQEYEVVRNQRDDAEHRAATWHERARWLYRKWQEANTMAVRNWHSWQEAERQLNDRQRRHTDEWQLAYEKGYGDMTARAEAAEAEVARLKAENAKYKGLWDAHFPDPETVDGMWEVASNTDTWVSAWKSSAIPDKNSPEDRTDVLCGGGGE